ncbi:MAG: ADP-forming succinate--CoA ligase subunit beta [Anaerolineae bacterium]
MRLHEYQSKTLFAEYGVPVPRGELVRDTDAAAAAAIRLGLPVVVKAQVLAGGRGKAGGVRLVRSQAEVQAAAQAILALTIQGLPVRALWVEPAVPIARELYLGLVVDRAARRVVLMASAEGGVDIEAVAHARPEAIARLRVDPFRGIVAHQVRYVRAFLGLDPALLPCLEGVIRGLYQAFVASDASLAEINPLVVTAGGELLALDAKLVLDDNALYRHADLEALRNAEEESPSEARARAAGLSYVSLGGTVGCLVNGAGLAMATLDTIRALGGLPANFLDIGGGARTERVAEALAIILGDANVRSILLNIFGGITRCDEVARGVAQAVESVGSRVPIVARLAGTNEEEGAAILARIGGVRTCASLQEAAQTAVALAAQQGEG